VSRLRVAVLAGGRSSEHDISVASAAAVVEGLREAGFEPVQIEITREGKWALPRADAGAGGGAQRRGVELQRGGRRPLGWGRRGGSRVRGGVAGTGDPALAPSGADAERPAGDLPIPRAEPDLAPFGTVDVVFPVLHGPFGEDGTVQGLLELADVPYVGPGVAASAVAMDKDLFKAVMRANDVPVTRSITVLARARSEVANPFGFPVVLKPARLGSSVGMTLARTPEEFEQGIDLAFAHDEKVLIEEYVTGVEIECSVLGNEEPFASVVGEIVPLKADWYDYASKYDEGGMDLIVPARIEPEQAARAQELAVRAFVACDCEGMARVDMFVRDNGEVLVNELNTIPGFTATSVYAKLLDASGIPYPELLRRLVELALERHDRRSRLRF
jgi:D-alanine-D-alanine ligase